MKDCWVILVVTDRTRGQNFAALPICRDMGCYFWTPAFDFLFLDEEVEFRQVPSFACAHTWASVRQSDLTPALCLLTTLVYKTQHKATHKPNHHQAFWCRAADGVVACPGKDQTNGISRMICLWETLLWHWLVKVSFQMKKKASSQLKAQGQILMDSGKVSFW